MLENWPQIVFGLFSKGRVCVVEQISEWSLFAGACCAKHHPIAWILMGLGRWRGRRDISYCCESGQQWRWVAESLAWAVRRPQSKGVKNRPSWPSSVSASGNRARAALQSGRRTRLHMECSCTCEFPLPTSGLENSGFLLVQGKEQRVTVPALA